MNMQKKLESYAEGEVQEMFREQVGRNWVVNEREFRNFCRLLSCLRKEFADLLRDDIHIVLWSLEREKRMDERKMPCCFLGRNVLETKKGIMFFSPYLPMRDRRYQKVRKILHEIAHYKLAQPPATDDETRDRNEGEADKQADEWMNEYEASQQKRLRPLRKNEADVFFR